MSAPRTAQKDGVAKRRVRTRPGVSVALPKELARPLPRATLERLALEADKPDEVLAKQLLDRGVLLLAQAYGATHDDGTPDLRHLIVSLAIDLRIPAFTSIDGSRGRGRPKKAGRLTDLRVFQLVTLYTRLPVRLRGRSNLTVDEACERIALIEDVDGVSADTIKRRYDEFRPQAEYLRNSVGMDLIAPIDEEIKRHIQNHLNKRAEEAKARSKSSRATR